MSEEPTQDIGEKYQTKPTIETVLERINALGEQLNARIDGLETRFDGMEKRFDGMEKRFDAVDDRLYDMGLKVKLLNNDVLQMRSDIEKMGERMKALESHFKEPA
jgi:predicted  nucleic acid-binding Zn-ribbon protein